MLKAVTLLSIQRMGAKLGEGMWAKTFGQLTFNQMTPFKAKPLLSNIYLSSCLSVCMSVCMNPVNGQAVGPILTKFGMGA